MSGLQNIRDAVAARASIRATLSRESSCAIDRLEAFANGRADLPPASLDKVVSFLWNGHIRYSAEADALMPVASAPARSVGVLPKLEMKLPVYKSGPPPRGPQPVNPAPKPQKRAGWVGGIGE